MDFIKPVAPSSVYSSAIHQLLSPFPSAAVTAKRNPSGAQSYSYTYVSAGEICRSFPLATSTTASRCSKNESFISPVWGVSATSGPDARVAFSVNKTATVFPSGDQLGVARKPFTLVNFFVSALVTLPSPPDTFATYSCRCPAFTKSDKNATRLPSGDQATLPSS